MEKTNYDITKKELNDFLSTEDHSPSPEELDKSEEALLRFTEEYKVQPPSHLKNKVLDKLRKLKYQKETQQTLDLHNLPRLTENSNLFSWKEIAAGITPPDDYSVYLHPLVQSDERDLFVVFAKDPIPEEVHHDLIETFLILEGTCECHITAEDGSFRIFRLGAGDVLSLKKGETHDIIITSDQPVVAILEWYYAAA